MLFCFKTLTDCIWIKGGIQILMLRGKSKLFICFSIQFILPFNFWKLMSLWDMGIPCYPYGMEWNGMGNSIPTPLVVPPYMIE